MRNCRCKICFLFVSVLVILLHLFAMDTITYAEVISPGLSYVDLNNWNQEGCLSHGEWEVQPGGRTITQSVNSFVTFYVGPEDVINKVITGTIQVDPVGDDDYIGLVLGFQDPTGNYPDPNQKDYDFILFDWKRLDQNLTYGLSKEGYSLSRVQGTLNTEEYYGGLGIESKYFWYHQEELPKFDILATNYSQDNGWEFGHEYIFKVLYTENRIKVVIDDEIIFDVTGEFQAGKIGFYNYSQGGVTYGRVKSAPGSSESASPVAQPDCYGMQMNGTLTIDKYDGILSNDYDPNLDSYTIIQESNPLKGTLTNLNQNGSFEYTPNPGETGLDSFTYHLQDAEGRQSESVTVTIGIIDGPNQAPTDIFISNDSVFLDATDGALVGTLSTEDANEGDTHDYLLIENSDARFALVDNRIIINDSSKLEPVGSYTITVRSTDFEGAFYQKDLNLFVQNRVPVVYDTAVSGIEDTLINFSTSKFTDSFTDSDGDGLSKVKVNILPENGILQLDGINIAEDQEIDFDDLDKIDFIPNSNWNGNTSFSWKGSDG